MKEHLASCPDCSKEFETIRDAKEVLASKEWVAAPLDMDFSFLKRLGEATRSKPSPLPAPAYVQFQWRYARPLAVSFAAVVFLFIASYYLGSPEAVVSHPQGTVKIYLARRNEWIPAEKPVKIGRHDIVKTFPNSQVDVTMLRVCSIRLKSNTELAVERLGSRIMKDDIRYTLTKGKVLIFHDPKAFRKNLFRIETPQALNTALGTDFMVNVFPEAQKTWVGVLDGKVAVRNLALPLQEVVVNAGQKTEIYATTPPSSPQALIDQEWNEIQELYQIGRKPQVALLISAGENRVRELLRLPPLYIEDRKESPLPALLKETAAVFNKAIREKSVEKHLEAIAKFEEIVSDFPDNKYNVQFLLFIGAYYAYVGQFEDAIGTFEKVIIGYPESHLTSLALCAIGIIYEEKLNNPGKARTAYQTILSRYPESPEAAQAKAGLTRLFQ